MAYVEPIKKRKQLKLVEKYLKDHHDPAFLLIWKIGIESGLRISDILRLRYRDINLTNGRCQIIESKGTLARETKAKYKVLKQVKEELLLHYQSKGLIKKMGCIYLTPSNKIMSFIPKSWQLSVNARLISATKAALPVTKEFYLSSSVMTIIKERQRQYRNLQCDSIFSRKTLSSNRAKKQEGILTRQACWHVFSKLTTVLKKTGVDVKVGCHTLRKSFARHLYFATGKDISLLMTMIGHQSERMSLRYIGLSKDETERAQKKLIHYLSR
ncbi:tyrosine-type recombinase/integrase [Aliivibrio sp. SR45-2]|uniref:tyrosine-type recombinase/integrase n=1 Tax=Aliivibrio sp. SR45-2 TaxID=2760931 RepID=UPI0015FC1201|nr:tyrosine-type recombinase/integrase [Aliivibrio sp. SR45-2]MBB1313407.1 tyrosine-type recombinase/integrase [Aliivibrio sp. SR45-2]